ncbi:unnamed protein product, partial [marine sediment metagenome]
DRIYSLEISKLKRDRLSMFVDVIRAAIPGRLITYLTPAARMNYKQCIPFLEVAVEKGLIHYDEETHIYTTTDPGGRYIRAYDRLRKVLEEE